MTILSAQNPLIDVTSASTFWFDQTGDTAPDQVIAGKRAALFAPTLASTHYAMGPQASLWLHYRFKGGSNLDAPHDDWLLQFPQPLLDKVTVYQRNTQGTWVTQKTGDTVSIPDGAYPGRYPKFSLLVGNGAGADGVHDVYVRIASSVGITLEANVTTHDMHSRIVQTEYLILGLAFGAMLLVMVTCFSQSWIHRDPTYSWYAAYVFLLALATSAWSGLGAQTIWQSWGIWPDVAPGVLGTLTGGVALLVVKKLCQPGARYKRFEKFLRYLACASLAVGALVFFLDRPAAVVILSAYLGTVMVSGYFCAALTWRNKDPVGMWVFIAFTPIVLAASTLVGDRVGVLPTSWFSQYGVLLGSAIEIPFLLLALNLRSKERHSVEGRAQSLTSHDALTGLLTAVLFQDRLRQTVSRVMRYKEPAAVVYIKLVNYGYIKKTWGVAVAEQSLLRSVMKLRRMLSDVDTVGRVDEAVFGLILEGVTERSAVTALSARLIASGLMPLKGLKPEVILQFHMAAVLVSERPANALETHEALTELLKHMGARTRRPIRFLEPELTRPIALEAQSEFDPEQTDPARRTVLPPA